LNFKEFIAAVRGHWITFVLVTAVVLALGLTSILLSPAKFVSSTQLMVSIEGSTTAAAYQNDDVVEGRINSYIPLLTSGVVAQRVVDTLGLPVTASELAAKITATRVPPRTSIIDVAVTDESPERARMIAQTLAREFIRYTEALETPTGEDSHKVHTTVVTAASEPHENRAERLLLALLAGIAALLMGAVAVWIRSRRTDPLVRNADQTAAAGAPVLGCVTAAPATSPDDLAEDDRPRTRLQATTNRSGDAKDRGEVLALTSTDGEVETAPIASNLGRAMELAGMRPIELNACAQGAETTDDEPVDEGSTDIEANSDGADDKPEVNNTEANVDELIDVGSATTNELSAPKIGADEISKVPSVNTPATDPNQMGTMVTPQLIDRLCSQYEQVIVAAPLLAPETGGSIPSGVAAQLLLALSIGETTRGDLSSAVEELRALGVPLTGAVLIGKLTTAPESSESTGARTPNPDTVTGSVS
jgi:capsular polysaccharide biosynthesis protein